MNRSLSLVLRRFEAPNLFFTDIDCDMNSVKSIKETSIDLSAVLQVAHSTKQRDVVIQGLEEWENEGGTAF